MSDSKSVDNGVRIVDVTGDGLPDFLKCSTAGQCKAWINTGSGWQRNDNWNPMRNYHWWLPVIIALPT
jgi:hypothetical protein